MENMLLSMIVMISLNMLVDVQNAAVIEEDFRHKYPCPEGCYIDGQCYPSGPTLPAPDPCTWCECNQGRVSCNPVICGELDCGDQMPVSLPAQCCDVCPSGEEKDVINRRDFNYIALYTNSNGTDTCVFGGMLYDWAEEVPSGDPCLRCFCDPWSEYQEPLCQAFFCWSECLGDQPLIPVPGQCCGRCPEGCYFDGIWYNQYDPIPAMDGCSGCHCDPRRRDLGYTMCMSRDCPALHCGHGIQQIWEPGHCCPSCPVM